MTKEELIKILDRALAFKKAIVYNNAIIYFDNYELVADNKILLLKSGDITFFISPISKMLKAQELRPLGLN